MNNERILFAAVAIILSAVFCRLFIPVLKRLKFGQNIRKEGNPEHLKKQGTPTMGGIAFLFAFIALSIPFAIREKELPVLLLTVGFGIVGFLDDILKIKKKQSEGLKAIEKLLLQIVFTGAFCIYGYLNKGTEVILPFTGGKTWDMGILYIPFVFIAILGTDNGTNLTDGLDGLLSSVTLVISLFFMIIISGEHEGLGIMSGIMAGALMGFLLFNTKPASVFMGDTGALALGGFVSATAISLKMGWFILLFGFIYLIETVSVILQVGYFKLTKGKRLFKMAPIHHHFELKGFSEPRIVIWASVITFIFCVISYFAL